MRRYQGRNQTIEPAQQPAALFFNASAGYRIMDARIFGQQIPPKNLTNSSTLAQDLQPTSQHMYLVVTTCTFPSWSGGCGAAC